MSLFDWISNPQKKGHDAASAPSAAPQGARAGGAALKDERARLRELLYTVVRESMVRVGVLSSSFKFKVLATDPRGRKFIVMMELSRELDSNLVQLAEIEQLICTTARARYRINVSAVYWRCANPVVAKPAPAPAATAKPAEPVQADELAALSRALASGVGGAATAPAATRSALTGFEKTEIIESRLPGADRHDDGPPTQLLDDDDPSTQLLDDEHSTQQLDEADEDDAHFPALGPTQYGDLR
ncbi:MAG: hypothetical protein Fur0019_14320 [Tibeticola sp.]